MSALRSSSDHPRLPILTHPGLWAAVSASLALKVVLLITGSVTFNGDEAILSLMARHILQGARPIFFYGQSYMGALDAYLIAASFAVFGQTVLAARLVQVLLTLGVVATTYLLAWRLSANRCAATVAALLVAIPSILVSLYTTAGIGDYVEVLLLNNLLLLVGWDVFSGRRDAAGWWLLLGLLAGVGWWSMALIVVSAGPLALIGACCFRPGSGRRVPWSRVGLGILGFAVGAAPWIGATLSNGSGVLAHLLGAQVNEVPTGSLGEVGQRAVSLLLFNFTSLVGLRPPWSLEWVLLPVGLLVAALYVIALWSAARRSAAPDESVTTRIALGTLVGGWVIVGLAFILTPFGRDPTGRYLLHLYPPLAILVGDWLAHLPRGAFLPPRARAVFPAALAAVCIGYNLWGNVGAVIHNPPGLTTQFDLISHLPHEYDDDLIEFLDSIGADRGYSNSWIAYRFAFQTHERLLFSPSLPYKSDLSYTYADQRYPPYVQAAAAASEVVYVTSNLPALDEILRMRFEALDVSYAEASIGPYTVFYDLSRHVTPEEIAPSGQFSQYRTVKVGSPQ